MLHHVSQLRIQRGVVLLLALVCHFSHHFQEGLCVFEQQSGTYVIRDIIFIIYVTLKVSYTIDKLRIYRIIENLKYISALFHCFYDLRSHNHTSSSDTNIAALHTIAIAKNVSSDQVLRAREINQRLTQNIQKSIQQHLEDMMLNEGSSDHFLHPHDLTKVLKQLEKMGIFFNIKTKNQIRELERGKRHAGKKTHEDDRELGGKTICLQIDRRI
jgi:hypothetical protein